jgi:hypothetical protein
VLASEGIERVPVGELHDATLGLNPSMDTDARLGDGGAPSTSLLHLHLSCNLLQIAAPQIRNQCTTGRFSGLAEQLL